MDSTQFRQALIGSGICDLVVADSTFRVVSVDLEITGPLWVGLPWRLDCLQLGVHLHELSWECFGQSGLN